MSADKEQHINPAAIGDESCHKPSDAMANNQPPRLWKPLTKPRKRRGTILASPIFDGRYEATQRPGSGFSDPAIIIDKGGNAVSGKEPGKTVVVTHTYPRARIDQSGGSWRGRLAARPQASGKWVPVSRGDDKVAGSNQTRPGGPVLDSAICSEKQEANQSLGSARI